MRKQSEPVYLHAFFSPRPGDLKCSSRSCSNPRATSCNHCGDALCISHLVVVSVEAGPMHMCFDCLPRKAQDRVTSELQRRTSAANVVPLRAVGKGA